MSVVVTLYVLPCRAPNDRRKNGAHQFAHIYAEVAVTRIVAVSNQCQFIIGEAHLQVLLLRWKEGTEALVTSIHMDVEVGFMTASKSCERDSV